MKMNISMMSVISFAGILLTGCSSTPTSEYTAFAQAGAGYSAAVDKLLTSAGIAQVDSTSWSLVVEKSTTGMDENTYNAKAKADKDRLAEISRLRSHAKLISEYFGHLESLATSDAPDKTKAAIEGVVANLKKLDSSLPQATSALPALSKFAVNYKINSALREELDQRKDLIRNELNLQEELLKELTDSITHAITLTKSSKEQELVLAPMISSSPLKDPEKWVSTRRDVTYLPVIVDEIKSASNAAKKLREAFEGLLSGEDTIGRINALISDLNGILDIVDAINS